MPLAYIGVGTNLGNRQENLHQATQALGRQVDLLRSSPIYETAPWGFLDQPAFLNQVLEIQTDIAPPDLLAALKQIEADMGRLPSVRYGPRLIDLDILFYGQECINLPGLTIPHPALCERAFVLVPLSDLAPELRHPVNGLLVKEILSRVDTSGVSLFQER